MFFSKDPVLKWEKYYCPHCNQPSGRTECEDEEGEEGVLVIVNNKTFTPFSKNCFYRRRNLWECHVNYPVSGPMLTEIWKADGVEDVGSDRAYTFKVSIGLEYDEEIVKQNIHRVILNFIKSLRTLELKDNKPHVLGISFPNGQSFDLNPRDVSVENDLVLRTLSTEIEGSFLKVSKGETHGSSS